MTDLKKEEEEQEVEKEECIHNKVIIGNGPEQTHLASHLTLPVLCPSVINNNKTF